MIKSRTYLNNLAGYIFLITTALIVSVTVFTQPAAMMFKGGKTEAKPLPRTIDFKISTSEPTPNFVTGIEVCITNASGAAVPVKEWVNGCFKSSNRILATKYTVPDTIRNTVLTATVTIKTSDPVTPQFKSAPVKFEFKEPDNPSYFNYLRNWEVKFSQLELEAQKRENKQLEPVKAGVVIQNAAGNCKLLIDKDYLDKQPLKIFLPVSDIFFDDKQIINLNGKFDTPQGNVEAKETIALPPNAVKPVVLIFDLDWSWQEDVRRKLETILINAGLDKKIVGRIVSVNLRRVVSGKPEWITDEGKMAYLYDKASLDRYLMTTYINLSNIDPTQADDTDDLMHEWTHEILFRTGWQPQVRDWCVSLGHDYGRTAGCETLASEEALCHFIGSYLIAHLLKGTGGFVVSKGARINDDNSDSKRQTAVNNRFQKVPAGSFVEDVAGGALIEVYKLLGKDPEINPGEALRTIFSDLKTFESVNGDKSKWSVENFLLHIRSKAPAAKQRQLDQLILWYLISGRSTINGLENVERLVPASLINISLFGSEAKINEKVNLKVSALAYERIVGSYRNYGGTSIKIRLFDGSKQVGNEIAFSSETPETGFNAAARLEPVFTEKGLHILHAEIWGDFIDGKMEKIGETKPLEIDVKDEKPENAKPAPNNLPAVSGKLSLMAPKEVLATELVDARAQLPAELQGKVSKYYWNPNSCADSQNSASAKLQFKNPLDGKPQQNNIYVSALDANNQSVASTSQNVVIRPVFFNGSATDVWKGGSSGYGLGLQRIAAVRKRENTNSATVSSQIEVKWADSFEPKNQEDIQRELTRRKGNDQNRTISAITVAGFKGFILETNGVRQGFTGSGYVDAGYPDASASGFGYAIKGCLAIEFSYSAGGSGNMFGEGTGFGKPEQAWWNDTPFLVSQTRAAAAEAKSILTGLTLTPDGTISFTSYKGPKLDGSDLASVKLVVSPDNKKLKKGDVADVRAVIENEQNADKSLQFDWTGDHAGSGANVKFLANKPGKQTLSVNVPNVGSASVEFEVADFKAEIVQAAPAAPKVTVGTPVTFSAKLLAGGAAVTGNYIYRWQPNPEVKFEPVESAANQSKAVFIRPGVTKVWVQILEKKGTVLETIAESEQIMIEVIKPEFKISFSPPTVLVGNELKARVDVTPADLKELDFRWELSPNARQKLESPDKREITLIPLDAKPITVTMRARVPVSGEELGVQTASLTAQKFDVKVNVIGPEGPRPQIWKEGIGLVPLDKGIAVNQLVGLRAEIQSVTENLRFEWVLNEDSQINGSGISQQIRVSRSQLGACTATVIVRDANGIELGRGSGTFNVNVSQSELDKSAKLAAAAGKLTQAKELIQKDQLDEAIILIDEFLAADPKNTEAIALAKKWKAEKAKIAIQLGKFRTFFDQNKFDEAERELLVAQQLHILYKPVVEADRELKAKRAKNAAGVAEGLGQVRQLNEAKNFKKALDLAVELRKNYVLTTASLAELTRYEDWARTHEAEKDRQRGILKQGEEKFKAGDYDGAIRDFDEMWKGFDIYWSIYTDSEPKTYENLRNEALRRRDRINTLMPVIKQATENTKFDKKQLEAALKNIDEVIQLQPNNQDAQNFKSIISDRLARGEKGLKSDVAMKLGVARHNEKKYDEAIREFDKVIKDEPANAEAYRRRAWSKLLNNDLKGAIKDYDKAIELDPGNFENFIRRGMAGVKSGDKNGALSDFSRAIELNPKYPMGYSFRGDLKIEFGDCSGAIQDYNLAIRLDPKNAANYTNRGLCKARQQDYKGALGDYDKSLEIDPGISVTYSNRGLVKEQTGNLKGALDDYQKALDIDPNNKTAAANLVNLKTRITGNNEVSVEALTGFARRLVSGEEVSGEAEEQQGPRRGRKWPFKLRITNYNRATGEVAGEINWTSLQSLHRIRGTLAGSKFNFTETEAIRAGGARLNVTYSITVQPDSAQGTYIDNGDRSGGSIRIFGAEAPSSEPKTASPNIPAGKEIEIFNNMNIYGVNNKPTAATTFTVAKPTVLTYIFTYHWNNAAGTRSPGYIGIYNAAGQKYGPWDAKGSAGQGGVPNAGWEVFPNIVIPAGTYTIYVSTLDTWSQNSQSGGQGMAIVKGYPATAAVSPSPTTVVNPAKPPVNANQGAFVVAVLQNRSNADTHIFAEGDTFGPQNKIAPGGNKEVSVKMTPDGRIKFYAGRNGQVISTKIWTGDPSDLNRYPKVIFDGSQLIITTGLR